MGRGGGRCQKQFYHPEPRRICGSSGANGAGNSRCAMCHYGCCIPPRLLPVLAVLRTARACIAACRRASSAGLITASSDAATGEPARSAGFARPNRGLGQGFSRPLERTAKEPSLRRVCGSGSGCFWRVLAVETGAFCLMSPFTVDAPTQSALTAVPAAGGRGRIF